MTAAQRAWKAYIAHESPQARPGGHFSLVYPFDASSASVAMNTQAVIDVVIDCQTCVRHRLVALRETPVQANTAI